MTDFPAQSPSAPLTPPTPSTPPTPPRDLLTQGMIEALRKTKPWVRFLSVLGFIFVGFAFLAGVGVAGFGVYQVTRGANEGWVFVGLSLVYIVTAVVYVFPSRYLSKYASSIQQAVDGRSKVVAVERALGYQKSFWKFAGIMTLIMILVYIPGVIAAIAIPNFLSATGRAREKRTMADLRMVAAALEARATDTNSYPQTRSIEELAKDLEPTYIRTLPRTDAWGHNFRYESVNCSYGVCSGYYVGSSGKNERFERERISDNPLGPPQVTTRSEDDIIFANGNFLRAPQGTGQE